MIAFLPLLILGVPLVLALLDLIATRSGARDMYPVAPAARLAGVPRDFRRGETPSPALARAVGAATPANIS